MLFKTKPTSHSAKILQQLKKAGRHGCYAHDLARANVGGLAWHRRITDLRKDGENIVMVRINRGLTKYYYVKEDPLET